MTAPKFTISQGDHGPEYFEGETKLAFTNASGTLQFTRGNSERRDEVEAWIERHNAHAPGKPQPVTEYEAEVIKETIQDQTVEKAPEQPINLPIICPIPGAPNLGDKDPEVIAWWQKNHPEEFKNRYAGRRIQTGSGIIV